MTRLMVIAIALVASAACLTIASLGAAHLGPWLQSHMAARWFVPACNLFVVGGLLISGQRRKKTAPRDDDRLTPLVRRDPRTGLRQL